MAGSREDRIRERAYRLWEAEEHAHGRHSEHWDQAVREIDEEDGAGSKTVKTATKKSSKDGAAKPKAAAAKPAKSKASKPKPAEPSSDAPAAAAAETASEASRRGRRPPAKA